jgi:hypothetical protein
MARPTDVVPTARRPAEVERALAELESLAARLATATAAVEAAESDLRDAERQDRETAAAALRQGRGKVAAEPVAVAKVRERVTAARRELDVIRLAQAAAEADLEQSLDRAAPAWTRELADEEDVARRKARELLAELEQTCAAVNAAVGAQGWLSDGASLDRPPRRPIAGSAAPSSASMSPNGAPFDAATIWGWVAELVDPPVPATRAMPRAVEAPAASDAA